MNSEGTPHDRRPFWRTNERRYHFVRAAYYGSLVCCMAVLPLSSEPDEEGWYILLVLVTFFALPMAFHIRQALRSSSETVVYLNPAAAPHELRLPYYRRVLWMSLALVPTVSAWIAWNLYQLETGAIDEISVYEPVASIYEHYGFVPAVAFSPVGGTLCILILLQKIRRLEGVPEDKRDVDAQSYSSD